jgi:hypothetical protein
VSFGGPVLQGQAPPSGVRAERAESLVVDRRPWIPGFLLNLAADDILPDPNRQILVALPIEVKPQPALTRPG